VDERDEGDMMNRYFGNCSWCCESIQEFISMHKAYLEPLGIVLLDRVEEFVLLKPLQIIGG